MALFRVVLGLTVTILVVLSAVEVLVRNVARDTPTATPTLMTNPRAPLPLPPQAAAVSNVQQRRQQQQHKKAEEDLFHNVESFVAEERQRVEVERRTQQQLVTHLVRRELERERALMHAVMLPTTPSSAWLDDGIDACRAHDAGEYHQYGGCVTGHVLILHHEHESGVHELLHALAVVWRELSLDVAPAQLLDDLAPHVAPAGIPTHRHAAAAAAFDHHVSQLRQRLDAAAKQRLDATHREAPVRLVVTMSLRAIEAARLSVHDVLGIAAHAGIHHLIVLHRGHLSRELAVSRRALAATDSEQLECKAHLRLTPEMLVRWEQLDRHYQQAMMSLSFPNQLVLSYEADMERDHMQTAALKVQHFLGSTKLLPLSLPSHDTASAAAATATTRSPSMMPAPQSRCRAIRDEIIDYAQVVDLLDGTRWATLLSHNPSPIETDPRVAVGLVVLADGS